MGLTTKRTPVRLVQVHRAVPALELMPVERQWMVPVPPMTMRCWIPSSPVLQRASPSGARGIRGAPPVIVFTAHDQEKGCRQPLMEIRRLLPMRVRRWVPVPLPVPVPVPQPLLLALCLAQRPRTRTPITPARHPSSCLAATPIRVSAGVSAHTHTRHRAPARLHTAVRCMHTQPHGEE